MCALYMKVEETLSEFETNYKRNRDSFSSEVSTLSFLLSYFVFVDSLYYYIPRKSIEFVI